MHEEWGRYPSNWVNLFKNSMSLFEYITAGIYMSALKQLLEFENFIGLFNKLFSVEWKPFSNIITFLSRISQLHYRTNISQFLHVQQSVKVGVKVLKLYITSFRGLYYFSQGKRFIVLCFLFQQLAMVLILSTLVMSKAVGFYMCIVDCRHAKFKCISLTDFWELQERRPTRKFESITISKKQHCMKWTVHDMQSLQNCKVENAI